MDAVMPKWSRRVESREVNRRELFVFIVCFHRHSRIVRSILESSSREVEESRSQPAVYQTAAEAVSRFFRLALRLSNSSTSRLFDLFLCFHRHSRFVPRVFKVANLASRQRAKSHHPQPLLVRGGEPGDSPRWIRRGQGWLISVPFLCFHRHSRFVFPVCPTSGDLLPRQQGTLPGRSRPVASLYYWAQLVKRRGGNGSIRQGKSEFRRPNGAG